MKTSVLSISQHVHIDNTYIQQTPPRFTFLDLFSGIGGFRIPLEKLGGKCLGYSEINKQAIQVYQSNFLDSDEICLGDITKKLGLKPRRSRAALIDYMYFMVDMVS